MKTKILAAIAVTALLAIGANGQGAGGAGGAGAGGTAGAGSGTSGRVNGGVNMVPNNPGNSGVVILTPSEGSANIPPQINPNTPVVGNGMAPNNLGLGSNNLALGTNEAGVGANQFSIRTNGLGNLAPTGPNGSGFQNNNIPVNPDTGTNRIILLGP